MSFCTIDPTSPSKLPPHCLLEQVPQRQVYLIKNAKGMQGSKP